MGREDFQMLDSFVVPASTNGLETATLIEQQQQRLQVCENKWIRIIADVKTVERRKMKDLREEKGTKACIDDKIVKSRTKMGRTHDQNERRDIAEKTWDKETWSLQKTRTTTAKMAGLPEERSKKDGRRAKVERKGQQQGAMGGNNNNRNRTAMSDHTLHTRDH